MIRTVLQTASRNALYKLAQRFKQSKSSILLPVFLATTLAGQSAEKQPVASCGVTHLDRCLVDVAKDQVGIFTSPFRMQTRDLMWLVPLGAATGTAIHFDSEAMRQLDTTQSTIDKSRKISDVGGIYAPVGGALLMYAVGAIAHNEHLRETGVLTTEAVLDATIMTQVLKMATNRERPNTGLGTGRFWPHGTRDYRLGTSFPSGHAAAAWSAARVISSEYPGWTTKFLVYGLATTVSVTRVTAREHFPSDALVGSAVGYLVGGYIYRHHSAEYDQSSFLMVTPEFNQRTHSYSARIDVPPAALLHPIRAVREALH